jgi:hypothetical protein
MSRFWMLACACAAGLALTAAPAFAVEPRQTADVIREGPPAPEDAAKLVAALKQKVEYDGSKIGEKPLVEVLQTLAKKHNITFVILDKEFEAKKVEGIKDKKSRVKNLDTKGMTVAEFLDAWLPGLGATYKIHEDYVAIVPLVATVQKVNPALKIRKDKAEAKADDPKPPAKKADATETILNTLEREVSLKDDVNISEIPLFELSQDFSKRFQLTFVINKEAFKAAGMPDPLQERPRIASTQLRGLNLRQFLTLTLESLGATYLVKNGTLEIVPVQFAAKLTKSATSEGEDSRPHLNEPLVSVIFKEKPLNEAVAKVAEMYDLTITIATQAGDAKAGFVNARILNMPADKAIELLALQCDLRVVRRGTAYMLTSKDHANELFNEKLDKERQKIEVEQLRKGAPKPKPAEKAGFKGGFGDHLNTGSIPLKGRNPADFTNPTIPGLVPLTPSVPKP